MDTSFGIATSNITRINDWHQLLGIDSSIANVTCNVSNISDDICACTNITLKNKLTDCIYTSIFVAGNNSKQVNVTPFVVSVANAVQLLNAFGYNIEFVGGIQLTAATKQILQSYKALGYNFVQKIFTPHNIPESGIFVSQSESNTVSAQNNMLKIESAPSFLTCDFSFLSVGDSYSIDNLID